MERLVVKGGIETYTHPPWGTHVCLFYESKEDLIEILVPYFKTGLENNQFCMWVTSEPLSVGDAERSLRRRVENLDEYLEKGQLEILDYRQWYIQSARFNADKVLQGCLEKETHALNKGFDGLRLSGNTLWLEATTRLDFATYEATVDRVLGEHRIIALCSYSLDRCGAAEIAEAVSNHKFSLLRRAGKWTTVESVERKWAEDALWESQSQLASLAKASPVGIFRTDAEGNCSYVNERWCEIAGLTPEEARGEGWTRGLHPDDRERISAEWYETAKKDLQFRSEYRFQNREGRTTWVYGQAVALRRDTGETVGYRGTITDITERKQAETALQDSEKRYRDLVDNSLGLICTHDLNGTLLSVNPAAARILGYQQEELVGQNLRGILAASVRYLLDEYLERIRRQPTDSGLLRVVTREAEERVWIYHNVRYEEAGKTPYVLGHAVDITERKQAEEKLLKAKVELEARVAERTSDLEKVVHRLHAELTSRERAEKNLTESLKEKEVLLSELQHRVKNNLQLVSSLIELQSGHVENEQAHRMFAATQERIKTMALIHEQLLGSGKVSKVDFDDYVQTLGTHLLGTYGTSADLITLKINVAGVFLTPKIGVPCGLIINELLSNCLTHAFPTGGPGEIRIDLHCDRDNRFTLVVSDNGVGVPRDMNFREPKTLGFQIVTALVDQLRGTLELRRTGGTQFRIRFSG